MARLQDLIAQITDESLRSQIQRETERLLKRKKFGLVFEDHVPECTPLYDQPVRVGSIVARKEVTLNEFFRVTALSQDSLATCQPLQGDLPAKSAEPVTLPLDELVCVAKFGQAIYPALTQLDAVENAPDSDLWHTLIEADNYHALQLLSYLYAGKVDCIYIDPPYNTGAKDWKYNNDYVDGNDNYRHSKWLSMMEKRLKLAKKLLNPKDSVLIVTIDEKEYLHLGCLLEELFPEARMQMVSVAINSSGVARDTEFRRTDEYYFFIFIGSAAPQALPLGQDWNTGGTKRQTDVRWESMLRSGTHSRRIDSPNLFYPVFFDANTQKCMGFGAPIPLEIKGSDAPPPRLDRNFALCF